MQGLQYRTLSCSLCPHPEDASSTISTPQIPFPFILSLHSFSNFIILQIPIFHPFYPFTLSLPIPSIQHIGVPLRWHPWSQRPAHPLNTSHHRMRLHLPTSTPLHQCAAAFHCGDPVAEGWEDGQVRGGRLDGD